MTTPLNREVRKALVRLAEQNAEYRKIARIILLLDAGRDIATIAAATKVTEQEVLMWQKRYEKEGLTLFAGVLPQTLITSTPTAQSSNPSSSQLQEPTITDIPSLFEGLPELPEVIPPPPKPNLPEPLHKKRKFVLPEGAPDPSSPISIGALAASFNIDMYQARHISRQLRELFDITANIHRLAPHFRDLLHACAMLHGIAKDLDPTDYAEYGREILLLYKLKELTLEERNLIATVIGLQNNDDIVHQDSAFQNLTDEQKKPAEIMVALLRIALALDSSNTQTSFIADHHQGPSELGLVIGGEDAQVNINAAQKASKLWNTIFNTPKLRFISEEQAEDASALEKLARGVVLSSHDYGIEVANKLRQHHTLRFTYLVRRIQRNEMGLLVPLWREFQKIVGVWQWLLPGSKPRQVFNEDTEWLEALIHNALFYATLEDRTIGLVNETDPNEDDPAAIRDLKTLAILHAEQAAKTYEMLRQALRSRRYERWLTSVQQEQADEHDTLTFSSQIGVRAWAYLGELRAIIDHVNAAGMNADLEELLTLEIVYSFEADLQHLTDLLHYSISLLGAEVQQVLQVLDPLSEYVQAWHRMEMVAQFAEHQQNAPPSDVSAFVCEAYAIIMRERANEMRWGLATMWEAIESPSFRRALALAVAKP
ncbi:MAG: hypothetical protein CUN55_02765 [Phototrophicales bacterium]|nr:MAG: hypothetical protein CUN55_02765 [Phototrophicales bacterium]